MDIRQATTSDIGEIREVARRSLTSSYDFLDEAILDGALEQWYTDDALEEAITEDSDVIIVGTVDGELVGFSQSSMIGTDDSVGEIQWIHVDPEYRDVGVGSELLDRTEEVLSASGVDRIRGLVLAGNESGTEFYGRHGFEATGDRWIDIGGESYEELFFETGSWPRDEADAAADRAEVDGEQVFVYRDEGDRGSRGMFFPAYRGRDRDELVGWVCTCGSTDNAMDSMGRLECNDCGNLRKPTRWDAAYL